jgi:predicted phage terminase large subunit-like protein
VKRELARKSFWEYCKLIAPSFYKEGRDYLKTFCNDLEAFYFGEDEVLICNMPPRHGKSRTVGLFAQWLFGVNNKLKIMTGSYNETLSTTFSKSVRNTISEAKAEEDKIVYSDVFPSTRIKRGDAAANLWGLEGGHYNYLATSPTGTATGFGCNVMIIDDVIKNAEEAYNENVMEKHWDWFTNTMLSRLEEGGKIIIVMTRWASKDLAGRALEHFKEEGKKMKHVTMKALQDNGEMLCDEVLSKQSYTSKIRAMGDDIASANYQQIPVDVKGVLYKELKTYSDIPQFEKIIAYTDTADEGADFLCSIVAGIYKGEAYLLDVYYTKDGMEITEIEVAKQFVVNNVNKAHIESNNGGRGFARAVQRILWDVHETKAVVVKWFHQSRNKMARILTNSSYVMEHIYFPEDWRYRWPEFYKAITEFQREGKNKHDDAADTLTGIAEIASKRGVGVLK